MSIVRDHWGDVSGEPVYRFTLTNGRGMETVVTNYGATLVGQTAPDQSGAMGDVVLGYDSVDEYVNGRGYFGATIGRVANRLGGGTFELDGAVHTVSMNKATYQLHGGAGGFHSRIWDAKVAGDEVVMTLVSPDGEEGYPGTVTATTVFAVTPDGVRITYRAVTDKPTVLTMTNHAYFTLGTPGESILDHVVRVNAARYLVTDADQVPTGDIAAVSGTPMDLTEPTRVGERVDADFEPLVIGHGFDHYYIIDGDAGALNRAATVTHPDTGRVLDVFTTQPGVQFYSGNHMAGNVDGKAGAVYGFRRGLCFETQGYVDAPNRPEFPSIVLRPGEQYEQTTEFRFSVETGKTA